MGWNLGIEFVEKKKTAPCKRPYSLGKRLESSDRKRSGILAAARAQLESNGFLSFTLEGLALNSGVTRQTIHNLFGTKAGVVEALFDQLALDGGLERMRSVMQQTNPASMLAGFVEIFTGFWIRDRLLIRRIHGIAAIDPEFGAVLEARNRRRLGAAARVVQMLDRDGGGRDGGRQNGAQRSATLYALTSFEFFDVLAEGCGGVEEGARLLFAIVEKALS
ncbi:MAG: helix-turn-helix domain-containing protein [Silvibacterium sp.]